MAAPIDLIINRKGTAKLNELLDIQVSMQKKWEDEKAFEIDAATPGSEEAKYDESLFKILHIIYTY